MQELRYPVGPFEVPAVVGPGERPALIQQIEQLPARLRSAVDGLDDAQLDTPYRTGGWTVRQVVHHMADSHVNGYFRFHLALTEEQPVAKSYAEARWAELPDACRGRIELSLSLLEGLHGRWLALLRALDEAQWSRQYHDPKLGLVSLDKALAKYAWHVRHHLAHITRLRERKGWS
jgi:hypothetical protein